jgi:predicted amidophosphoribosyltransferase
MTNSGISKLGFKAPFTKAQMEAHLKAFDKVKVKHPKINDAFAKAHRMIGPYTGADIGMIVGPTGVGKTAMINLLARAIQREYAEEMVADPSIVPVVVVPAPSDGEKRSRPWAQFYSRVGEILNEPLLNRKSETCLMEDQTMVKTSLHTPTRQLRASIEIALKQRKTKVLIIDEAAHLFTYGGGVLAEDFDTLKSLCVDLGITLLVVGSYDLFDILQLSGQIMRRTQIIHMERYMPATEKDVGHFERVIGELQKAFPLTSIPDLTVYAQILQTATVGCVGTLQQTFARLLNYTLINEGVFTMEIFQDALLSETQLAAMLAETISGEARVAAHSRKPFNLEAA